MIEIEAQRSVCEVAACGCDLFVTVEERSSSGGELELERNLQAIDHDRRIPHSVKRLRHGRRERQSNRNKNSIRHGSPLQDQPPPPTAPSEPAADSAGPYVNYRTTAIEPQPCNLKPVRDDNWIWIRRS